MNTSMKRYYIVKVTFHPDTPTTQIELLVTVLADSSSEALQAAAAHTFLDSYIQSVEIVETDSIYIIQGER